MVPFLIALAVATAGAPGVELSVQQAMERAGQRAPQVVLAESALREAEASRAGAGVILPANPRLFGEARAGGGAGGYAANLEAPFELFGAPGARVAEAKVRASAAQAELELERYLARYLAFELYVEVRITGLRLAEARSAIELATGVEGASRRLLETGAASDIDLAVASASLAEFRAEREALLAREQDALLPFRELLGLEPGSPVTLTTPLEAPPSCAVVRPVGRDTEEGHPSLRAIQARLVLGERSLDRLAKEVRPRLSFLIGVDAAPKSEGYGLLGLGVELPVAQRNEGPRAVVSAQLATERTRLDLTAQRLLRELDARRASCDARRREVDLLGSVAVPNARRALQLVEAGWRAGKFDVFRVNAAARDVVRLGQARLEVLGAAWREHVAIQRLAGGEP
jgi:cobalt-zinc-cadmium efflux system outer membrane protein